MQTKNRKIFFILFLLSSSLLLSNQSNSKPVILWDLHGVLLKQKDPITAIAHSGELSPALQNLDWQQIRDFVSLILSNMIRDTSSEEYLAIPQKYHNKALFKLILSVANAQELRPGMLEIVQQLHDRNYRQLIASNIGPTSYEQITNPKKYPALAPLFSYISSKDPQIAYQKNGRYIKKPMPEYYQDLLTRYNLDPEKQHVLFIDDLASNVAAAREFGIDAILFQNSGQLQRALSERDLLPMPKALHNQKPRFTKRLYDPKLFYFDAYC